MEDFANHWGGKLTGDGGRVGRGPSHWKFCFLNPSCCTQNGRQSQNELSFREFTSVRSKRWERGLIPVKTEKKKTGTRGTKVLRKASIARLVAI